MIALNAISKVYNMGTQQVHALRDITLRITPGQFACIVGASGSGKSTLMHIIGCLDLPTGGRYALAGRCMGNLAVKDLAYVRSRQIGFVFQSFNLLPRMSALENVELALLYRDMPAPVRRRRACEALQRMGLGARLEHRPSQMSGGQQQRVAIARAIVGDPCVILADEPTGSLDSKSGADVLALLCELNREGRTVLLITHDMQVANSAQRIIRLHDGQIVSDEPAGM